MKSYIISMKEPDSPSLRELFRCLNDAGFEPVLVPGVKGRDLLAKNYFQQIYRYFGETGRLISPAEAGCSLSHLEIYRQFTQSAGTHALVFEDDVIVDPKSLGIIFQLAQLPLPDRYILHLGGQEGLEHRIAKARGKLNDREFDVWEVCPQDLKYILRTVAYILPKVTAAALLDLFDGGIAVADDFDYFLNYGAIDRFYFCNMTRHPADLEGSTIQTERQRLLSVTSNTDVGAMHAIKREVGRGIQSRLTETQRSWNKGEYRKFFTPKHK